jgi:hypothetical protein
MLAYCDSMILVYYMEHIGTWQVRAASRLAAMRAAGDEVVVSDLTRLECRVVPIRAGDSALLAKYDAFFSLGRSAACSLDERGVRQSDVDPGTTWFQNARRNPPRRRGRAPLRRLPDQ